MDRLKNWIAQHNRTRLKGALNRYFDRRGGEALRMRVETITADRTTFTKSRTEGSVEPSGFTSTTHGQKKTLNVTDSFEARYTDDKPYIVILAREAYLRPESELVPGEEVWVVGCRNTKHRRIDAAAVYIPRLQRGIDLSLQYSRLWLLLPLLFQTIISLMFQMVASQIPGPSNSAIFYLSNVYSIFLGFVGNALLLSSPLTLLISGLLYRRMTSRMTVIPLESWDLLVDVFYRKLDISIDEADAPRDHETRHTEIDLGEIREKVEDIILLAGPWLILLIGSSSVVTSAMTYGFNASSTLVFYYFVTFIAVSLIIYRGKYSPHNILAFGLSVTLAMLLLQGGFAIRLFSSAIMQVPLFPVFLIFSLHLGIILIVIALGVMFWNLIVESNEGSQEEKEEKLAMTLGEPASAK